MCWIWCATRRRENDLYEKLSALADFCVGDGDICIVGADKLESELSMDRMCCMYRRYYSGGNILQVPEMQSTAEFQGKAAAVLSGVRLRNRMGRGMIIVYGS